MADDSSSPPLSRRVPGATNRPKPQMRVAPPVLPDDLIDRLRPKDDGTAEATTELPRRQRNKKPPEAKRQEAAAGEQSALDAPETWYVVPDSPSAPIADGNDTTQPLPVISGSAPPPAQARTEVKPASREERLARRERSQPAGFSQPRGFAQAADLAQLVGPGQTVDVGKRPSPPQPDHQAPPDRSAPADQRPPSDRRPPPSDRRPPSSSVRHLISARQCARPSRRVEPAIRPRRWNRSRPRPRAQRRPSLRGSARAAAKPARQRPAAVKPARRRAAVTASGTEPLRLPGPFAAWFRRRVVGLLAALSRSGQQQSEQSLLRPLFRESLSIEEMVAAVRAQDAGRRADQARRFRLATVAVVVLIVMVATAVVVVVIG